MPLKNYSTTVSANDSIAQIDAALVEIGAREIRKRIGSGGFVESLAFIVKIGDLTLAYELPVRRDKVRAVLIQEKKQFPRAQIKTDERSAYAIAWRTIRDWILAQLALLRTEQVEANEVFLPYMLDRDGQTLYGRLKAAQFALPPPHTPKETVR